MKNAYKLLICLPFYVIAYLLLLSDTIQAKTPAFPVTFFEGTFDEALKRASHEDKFVFVYPVSQSCGTCSIVANNLFTNNDVAAMHNRNFINYTLDVDEITYHNFARVHDIGIQPTVMFFNPKGDLVTLQNNVNQPEQLVYISAQILNDEARTVDNHSNMLSMGEKYRLGFKDPDFLRDYAYLLKLFNLPFNTVVNEYLATQTLITMQSRQNREFVFHFSDNIENKAIDFFIVDIYNYKKELDSDMVNQRVKMAVYNGVRTAIKMRDVDFFNKAIRIAKESDLPDLDRFLYYLSTDFYEGIKDWENFAKYSIEYFDNHNEENPRILNDAAFKFHMFVQSKSKLKEALNWVEKSIGIESEYYNNYTLALLYNQLEKTDEALLASQKSIDMAKRAGNVNYIDAQRLMDVINSKKY